MRKAELQERLAEALSGAGKWERRAEMARSQYTEWAKLASNAQGRILELQESHDAYEVDNHKLRGRRDKWKALAEERLKKGDAVLESLRATLEELEETKVRLAGAREGREKLGREATALQVSLRESEHSLVVANHKLLKAENGLAKLQELMAKIRPYRELNKACPACGDSSEWERVELRREGQFSYLHAWCSRCGAEHAFHHAEAR